MDNTSGYLSSIEDIEKIYNKVVNMREETLQFIFDSNDSVLLSDLPIALLFKKKVETELKDLINILICLEEKTDYDVGGVIVKIQEFGSKLPFVIKNSGILLNTELLESYMLMKQKMKGIYNKLNERSQQLLLGDSKFNADQFVDQDEKSKSQ